MKQDTVDDAYNLMSFVVGFLPIGSAAEEGWRVHGITDRERDIANHVDIDLRVVRFGRSCLTPKHTDMLVTSLRGLADRLAAEAQSVREHNVRIMQHDDSDHQREEDADL